ncbi:phosphoribosylamine--glycine ligase [Chloroflexota bacterium]
MRILVVGGGGREHTLVWKLAQSPAVDKVYVAPGNAGTASIAENVDISPNDFDAIANLANGKGIDLVMVGPEVPLAAGIVDYLHSVGITTFGPTKEASLIEASKTFSKELMFKYDIPCAKSQSFTSLPDAQSYIKTQPFPIVIKADGLAAGKGVIIAATEQEAFAALEDIMGSRVFGDAGNMVLIEECMVGKEVSLLVFTDGTTVVPMVPACDYKRIGDNDDGLNTGGMGSYSPPGFFDGKLKADVIKRIAKPVVDAMNEEGKPYRGVLYIGLMMTSEGPKVLEFNARFGDPETQVILPRLKTDLVEIMQAVIDGRLDEINIEWSDEPCVGVVMASGGYPGKYQTGYEIEGLDNLDSDIQVFHAGTKLDGSKVLTSGGRVLTVVASGKSIAEARDKVYANIPRVRFDGATHRTDIALREVM